MFNERERSTTRFSSKLRGIIAMIVFKDIEAPMDSVFASAAILNNPKQNITLRVFYDDSWLDEKKDCIVFFSGGTGLNIQTETSVRPMYGVNSGFVYIDVMTVPSNFDVSRNFNFPNTYITGTSVDVLMTTRVLNTIHSDLDLGKYLKQDSKYALLGHSRGGVAIQEYLQNTATKGVQPPLNIKSYTINSPSSSGEGGYTAPDRMFRMVNQNYNQNKIKLRYTVGEGDTTHTARSVMERTYRYGMSQLSNIDFVIVGDSRFTHDYPTTVDDNIYRSFIDFAINDLQKP